MCICRNNVIRQDTGVCFIDRARRKRQRLLGAYTDFGMGVGHLTECADDDVDRGEQFEQLGFPYGPSGREDLLDRVGGKQVSHLSSSLEEEVRALLPDH